MVDDRFVDIETRIGRDPTDVFAHQLSTQQPELEDLAAAPDRLRDLVRFGCRKYPNHVIGRLL